jgi:hypothetical protein
MSVAIRYWVKMLERSPMKRAVVTGCAAYLCAYAVLAASPQVESAIKTFKAMGADAAKLSSFCAMIKTLDAADEKDDDALDAKIADLVKQLGPEFEEAWRTADDVEEDSEDGKALNAAIDEVMAKCPQ